MVSLLTGSGRWYRGIGMIRLDLGGGFGIGGRRRLSFIRACGREAGKEKAEEEADGDREGLEGYRQGR